MLHLSIFYLLHIDIQKKQPHIPPSAHFHGLNNQVDLPSLPKKEEFVKIVLKKFLYAKWCIIECILLFQITWQVSTPGFPPAHIIVLYIFLKPSNTSWQSSLLHTLIFTSLSIRDEVPRKDSLPHPVKIK